MSSQPVLSQLARRERQIMDVLFQRGKATAAEVLADLPDAPSNAAVRGMLRHLEEKGFVRHEQDGPRYLYSAAVERDDAGRSALAHMLRTFFGGSRENAMAALISMDDGGLSDAEYERLARLLDDARGGSE
jgi:BlaI family transcriptional regulator, penicillinase repressor